MAHSKEFPFGKLSSVGKAFLIALLGVVTAFSAPSFNNNLIPIIVDGSTVASGFAVSLVFDGGVYHLWYRTTIGDISGIHHATSIDGINFTTTGALSFAVDPFAAGMAPFLYYENVAKVGTDYKMFHWTPNGSAGTFPAYNYNISVSNIGPNPNNLVVTHQGPIGGMGIVGFSAGPFGLVNGLLYCQSDLGRELCRATYTDGSPPNVGAPAANTDFSALFAAVGNPTGYINNHSDVIQLGPTLDFFFTMRDGVGNRFNQQVYFSESRDNGVTWSDPVGLFTAPTLNGGALGGNFAHAEAVVAGNILHLYLSTQDPAGNFVIATTAASPLRGAYQLSYISNLNAGDSVVNLTNTGLNGTFGIFGNVGTAGNMCANVYVFDPQEEMIACCSCLVTPNGLNSLSAKGDLISNTLTPAVPTSIVVKIVSTQPEETVAGSGNLATCNPGLIDVDPLEAGGLAWNTSLHLNTSIPNGAYRVTETPFRFADLSTAEENQLAAFCRFTQIGGSGFGVCRSCINNGRGGAKK